MRRGLLWLILGAGLAGLLVLSPSRGFLGLSRKADQSYSRDHQRLFESLGASRSIEARLSGQLSYKPYRPPAANRSPTKAAPTATTARGGSALEEISSGQQVSKEAALAIQKAAERDPSPENRAALAILDLVQGNPNAAVPLLREAHRQKPADPRILNDLSAALLSLSDAKGDLWAGLEAIETAKQAERLEASPPALFNLALALERQGLRARAIAAWNRYLEVDPRSHWAGEAGKRRSRLEQEVAKARAGPRLPATPAEDLAEFPDNPWAARQLGERVLLSRWAERTLAGRPADAETALSQAEKLAASLSPEGGRLLSASAGAIREAEQGGDRVRLALLARGHKAFGQAFLRWRQERAGEARAPVEDAIRDLEAAQSPFALRARLLRAWMVVTEPDWVELRQIGETAEGEGFLAIAAETRRIAAYQMTLQGRLEASADLYEDARARFAAINEMEAAAVISSLRSELLAFLGRPRESSAELATALAAGPWMADPWDRYSTYAVAAGAASSRFKRAAVELWLEAADSCRDLPERPLCAVDSWLGVAALAPDADVAGNALQHAGASLSTVPDSDGKARTKIDLAVALADRLAGDGRSRSEREEAAVRYGTAAAAYEGRGLAVSAAFVRAARAKLLQRLGRAEEAVAEYQAGLGRFRLWDQSDRFRPERAEKGSPATLRDAYEGLLAAEIELAGNGPSVAAFLLSEEMRDRLAPRRSAEIWLPAERDVPRFAAAVPPATAIVEHAVFGDQAAAWVLVGGRPIDQVKLTPAGKLGERIGALARERQLDAWKRTSGALFQDLLAPVLRRLPAGTKRLVLIPDSQLYGLPFRALWNPASGHYLDEDFTLSLAPSVRQLLGSGDDRRSAPAATGPAAGALSVLSLGFQSFHPDLHLAKLEQAAAEAAAVFGVYGSSARSCPALDWAGFRQCAPQADVLHLATHAAASGGDQSWLAFPQETVSLERLWRELPVLPRHPVVVLSACQSVATAKGGEGLGGLARPFLASGARAVVGTLWKLNDADAINLFPAFHRAYHKSGDAAGGLREAREALAKWQELPWVWGGVEVLENTAD